MIANLGCSLLLWYVNKTIANMRLVIYIFYVNKMADLIINT